MPKYSLKEILEDSDIKEHATKIYLNTICEGFPCEEKFSSEIDYKKIIVKLLDQLSERETGKDKFFEEILNEGYKDLKDEQESGIHPIKIEYLNKVLESVKSNRDLIFKMVDEFPQRLKAGRDRLLEIYDAKDDISAYDLFEKLVGYI